MTTNESTLERARREITERLAYWQRKDVRDSTAKASVVANLEWALVQLEDAPTSSLNSSNDWWHFPGGQPA